MGSNLPGKDQTLFFASRIRTTEGRILPKPRSNPLSEGKNVPRTGFRSRKLTSNPLKTGKEDSKLGSNDPSMGSNVSGKVRTYSWKGSNDRRRGSNDPWRGSNDSWRGSNPSRGGSNPSRGGSNPSRGGSNDSNDVRTIPGRDERLTRWFIEIMPEEPKAPLLTTRRSRLRCTRQCDSVHAAETAERTSVCDPGKQIIKQ